MNATAPASTKDVTDLLTNVHDVCHPRIDKAPAAKIENDNNVNNA